MNPSTQRIPCRLSGRDRQVLRFALGAVLVVASLAAAPGPVAVWDFAALSDGAVAGSPATAPILRVDHANVATEPGGARVLVCDGFETAGRLAEAKPLRFADGFSLAVWVRPARDAENEPVVGRPNPNPKWATPVTGFTLDELRPVFGLFTTKAKFVISGPEIPLHAWSMLTVTLDGRDATLWVDDRKVAAVAQTIPIPTESLTPWFVGRGLVNYFQGRLGEIRIWSRALAPEEVSALHRETAARYMNAPVAAAPAPRWRDRTVPVESPGSTFEGQWRARPTRTLAGLDGFKPVAPPAVDAWGGRLDRPARAATGFFRVERMGDRWWLVTPAGHLYWNVAVNQVKPPKGVSAESFAQRASDELRDLGFNGVGNSSVAQLRRVTSPIPGVLRLNFAAAFAAEHKQTYKTGGHTGFTAQCVPTFHPDFPAWAQRYAKILEPDVEDPAIVGIFTDNELECSADLLDRHLALDPKDPYLRHGREGALAWLAARGTPADPARFTLRDRYEFIAYVFETYSRIVHDAVRAYDRRHLILGSRFHVHIGQFDNPWFWKAVGPWMDVVSANYYRLWGPQRAEIQGWSDDARRPLMLTEWYAKGLDAPGLANKLGAGWTVRTQADRGLYYEHFALSAFEHPALVGFHFYKYMDDTVESQALDSAGGANKGLFDSAGKPWTVLLEKARAVNHAVYPLIDFFDARR